MLTDVRIRQAKVEARQRKLFDEKGLFLLVKPTGAKLWQQKYRWQGREKTLSHGPYPDVTIRRAREKRDEARRALADGHDPGEQKRAAKAAQRNAMANTFEALAQEWFDQFRRSRALKNQALSAATIKKTCWLLNLPEYREAGEVRGQHPLRRLSDMPAGSITRGDVGAVIRGLIDRGKVETARRMFRRLDHVFRFAIATGRMNHNPAAEYRDSGDPRDEMPTIRAKHHAGITDPREFGALLRAIDGYSGQPATEAALRLAPLLFVRPGELRGTRWEELDLEAKEPIWRIPEERMKQRRPHVVPLAPQAVEIFQQQMALSGPSGLVFPAVTDPRRPISENTLTAALRRMGYTSDQQTWHGFRTSASTLLHELGWDTELIELQLSHSDQNSVRAAYNRSERLADRRKLMLAWADHLDGLRAAKA